MTRTTRTVFCLLFLLCAACATDVTANYRGSDPSWHFGTNMRLTTSFNLSLVSGTVVSGNPNNLQSGDTVCSGAVVSVNPSYNTKWAVSALNITSIYPSCGGGAYCPVMLPGPALSANRDINWLAAPVFDAQKSFGDANDWSQDQVKDSQLGSFSTEPMAYDNGTISTNKEGGAAIVCKGAFQVLDGAAVLGSGAMPATTPIQFTVNNSGSRSLSTVLNGVSCFGAVEKHPVNKVDHTNWFYLYYFTHNPPAIPATSAANTITLNVAVSGGTCNMHTASISVSRAANASGTTMVRTTVHNDADAILVRNVTSSDAQFVATPFPVGLGSILGFGALSPASNGFNETINPTASKDLYVLVTTSASSGGTVLTFNAETLGAACGTSGRCSINLDLGDNVTMCNIVPTALDLANNVSNGQVVSSELGQLSVFCQDLAGGSIPCVGSNWAATPALRATFLSEDNTGAQVYSTAVPPVSGTVTYTSGIAQCNSTLNIKTQQDIINNGNTTYACSFTPPGADMGLDAQQYFALNCMRNATIPTAPDDANFDAINGLGGSISNTSVAGATYTAPGAATSGDLQGVGLFNVRPNVIGAVALAPITVSINGTIVNCSIQPNSTSLGQGITGLFTVACTNQGGATVPCSGNAWAWASISGGFTGGFYAPETDNTHAWAFPDKTAPVGSVGLLTYTSGQAVCNSTVTTTLPDFSCNFNPASANVAVNGTKHFELHAYDLRSGSPVEITPVNAFYDLINGLAGAHSNDSVSGTNYNAPDANTSGNLQGIAQVNSGNPNEIGPECEAAIQVGNGGVPPGPGGSTQFCTIMPASSNFFAGAKIIVSIWCGPKANQSCSGVVWSGTGVTPISATDMGTYVIITAPNGTGGEITAYVNNDKKQACSLPFNSGVNDCADLS